MDHSEKEWERHDLLFEEIQRAINEWNNDKPKQIKPLPPESHLSNFYHLPVNEQNYLLQLVQNLQHMLAKSALSKWQIKNCRSSTITYILCFVLRAR